MGRFVTRLFAAMLAAALILPENGLAAVSKQRRKVSTEAGEQTVLILSGVIGPGSHRAFRRLVAREKPDLVLLDGPGGVLGEALLIGDEIRARRISTAVSARNTCASACAVVFLSGRTKYMGKGASVGLHMARYADGRRSPTGTAVMASYLRGMGVPNRVLARMAKTAPDDITWLSRSEQKALKIRSF